MTNFTRARGGAAIQRSINYQAASNAGSDEYAQHIASAARGSAFELAVDTGVHVILDDRRAAELLSRARTQWKVFEFEIRCFDYVAGFEIDWPGRADSNRGQLIDFDASVFDRLMPDLHDRSKDFFVVTPAASLCARAAGELAIAVHHSGHDFGSAEVYSKNMLGHSCRIRPQNGIPGRFPDGRSEFRG